MSEPTQKTTHEGPTWRQWIAARRTRLSALGPGVLLASVIAMAARFISERYGGPVMLYALLFGIAFNFLKDDPQTAPGITFSAKSILRLGVALLGARITIEQVTTLGGSIALLVPIGVMFTIVIGWGIGRAFKLRTDHALLSAGSVAICGASAALAISSVLPNHKDKELNTILTVIGVTTLSTIAMIFYPILTSMLELSDRVAGVFIGATIHDVAQVVGAGYMISETAGDTSTVVKLMRVAMLVPTVVIISGVFRPKTEGKKTRAVPLPGFLLGFIALVGIGSLALIPSWLSQVLRHVSSWCIVAAVAALGVKTSPKEVVDVGPRPIAAMALQTAFIALFVLTWLFVVRF